ncbi:MAG TPA: hypothetical protein ENJ57_00840 [Rhizobiales bacterium]|nr:hypothetical protein [Hyphomicrobiales bacterium]
MFQFKNHYTMRIITALTMGYWFVFWALNGLDKFLCREDLGLIKWYGNDRVDKFGMYMDRLGIGSDGVTGTLWFAGIWELGVAALCFYGLLLAFRTTDMRHRLHVFALALGGSVLTFIGFCIFDVVVGDRAELLEHSTYIGVVIISYMAVVLEPVFVELVANYNQNNKPHPV